MTNKEKSVVDYLKNIETIVTNGTNQYEGKDLYLGQPIVNKTKLPLEKINIDDIINKGVGYVVEPDIIDFNARKKKIINNLMILIIIILLSLIAAIVLFSIYLDLVILYAVFDAIILMFTSILTYKIAKRKNVFKTNSIWNYKNVKCYVYEGKLKSIAKFSILKNVHLTIMLNLIIFLVCVFYNIFAKKNVYAPIFTLINFFLNLIWILVYDKLIRNFKSSWGTFIFIYNNLKLSHNDTGWTLEEV